MGVTVRRFHWDDSPALLPLFRDTVRRVNSRDYSPEQVEAWAAGRDDPGRWRELFAERYTVIAEIDAQIVGFAELDIDGHIDRFYVHADFQRRGVGATMMKELFAEALRLGIFRLNSEVSITARPFFERFGFTVVSAQTVEFRGVQFLNYRMERTFPFGQPLTF